VESIGADDSKTDSQHVKMVYTNPQLGTTFGLTSLYLQYDDDKYIDMSVTSIYFVNSAMELLKEWDTAVGARNLKRLQRAFH